MIQKSEKKKIELRVEKRKIFGRKVKNLRQEGVLPANLYGKKVKSQALQLDLKSFLPIFQQVGETGVVHLQLKEDKEDHPVLIHNVQIDPVTDQLLHADFYQVSLKEKVTAEIPVELVGESLVIKEKRGVLIQSLLEVEVEALPTDLPDKFEIDISSLAEVNAAVMVKDLKVGEGVKILTDSQQILAKIEPLAKEEEVTPPPSVETPIEGEEKPAEGEPPSETPQKEEGQKVSEETGKAPGGKAKTTAE